MSKDREIKGRPCLNPEELPSLKDEQCQAPLSLPLSFSVSLSAGYTTSPGALWPFSSSSTHSHTHHTHDLLSYTHICLCVCVCAQMHACAHMCSVCMAAATSNTLKQHSSETLPHPFSFPHSDSNTEKKSTFQNLKKLINKSKGRLHLAQCLYLRFPSMCLGRRSGRTEPESAWKQ